MSETINYAVGQTLRGDQNNGLVDLPVGTQIEDAAETWMVVRWLGGLWTWERKADGWVPIKGEGIEDFGDKPNEIMLSAYTIVHLPE